MPMNACFVVFLFAVALCLQSSFAIPESVNWCSYNGTNYCGIVQNQHSPQYCGACYAFAAASVWQDRVNIMKTNTMYHPPYLSVQNILDCVEMATCSGGEPIEMLQYMQKTGLPDATCSPYIAKVTQCVPSTECYTCNDELHLDYRYIYPEGEFTRYHVKEFGMVSTEQEMMTEIATNGPIMCMIAGDAIKWYNSTDTLLYQPGQGSIDHTVEVVGYGIDSNGVKTWTIKNSWGTAWNRPMGGFITIERGKNTIGIESGMCWHFVPVLPKSALI